MWEVVKKNRPGKVSMNLKYSELACKCGYSNCHFTLLYYPSIDAFNYTRNDFGEPIIMTSAFRCQSHNTDVGGVDESYHTKGMAHDLMPVNREDDAFDRLHEIAQRYYDVVIPYHSKGFIHCHKLGVEK